MRRSISTRRAHRRSELLDEEWQSCEKCRRYVLGLQECAEVRKAEADALRVRLQGMAWVLQKLLRHCGELPEELREGIDSFAHTESRGRIGSLADEVSTMCDQSVPSLNPSCASSPPGISHSSLRYSLANSTALDLVLSDDEDQGHTRSRESCDGDKRSVSVPRSFVWDHPLSQREKAMRVMQLFEDECAAAHADELELASCPEHRRCSSCSSRRAVSAVSPVPALHERGRRHTEEGPLSRRFSRGKRAVSEKGTASAFGPGLIDTSVRQLRSPRSLELALEGMPGDRKPDALWGVDRPQGEGEQDVRISRQCFALLQRLDDLDAAPAPAWRTKIALQPLPSEAQPGSMILERAKDVAAEFIPWV